MEITNRAELLQVIADLQGEMSNMRETIDKLAPVEEKAEDADPEEKPAAEEEPSEEEVDDIDKLLQEN